MGDDPQNRATNDGKLMAKPNEHYDTLAALHPIGKSH